MHKKSQFIRKALVLLRGRAQVTGRGNDFSGGGAPKYA